MRLALCNIFFSCTLLIAACGGGEEKTSTTEHGTSYTEMILPGEEKSVPTAAGDAATEQDIAKLRSKI